MSHSLTVECGQGTSGFHPPSLAYPVVKLSLDLWIVNYCWHFLVKQRKRKMRLKKTNIFQKAFSSAGTVPPIGPDPLVKFQ